MHKIKIISVNKTKESWLEEAIDEYLKRLKAFASIEFIYCKNDDQLLALCDKQENLICLDSTGNAMDSETFSLFLMKQLVIGGSRLTIVIGGANGLPQQLKDKSLLISLSKMTFTHQIVRLILVEQIYRSFEIEKGTKYHK